MNNKIIFNIYLVNLSKQTSKVTATFEITKNWIIAPKALQEIYPDSGAYTLHLQRISAATRAGLVMVEMKEKTFRNILDIAKKAGVTRRF
jgi:hypothetical protein